MPDIDPARVRRLFLRRPAAGADFILREVAGRMAERLDYIRLDPADVLDAGCGGGADLERAAQRYPAARLVGVDVTAVPAVPAGWRGLAARWARRPRVLRVRADFGALPFASGRFDLLWSNCALHWHPAPHLVLPEWHRVLRVGGLVLFSVFGPDTLKEVRAAFAAADPGHAPAAHVADFTDLHDYGDMLVASGFATPVMDVERLTLTYADAASLWRDVRALGGNPAAARSRGLFGRTARRRLDQALDASRDATGRYQLSFEIIYGHAWRAEPRQTARGEAIVRFEPGRQRRGR